MIIIKKPKNVIVECKNCGCKYEFEPKDIEEQCSSLNGKKFLIVECPYCKSAEYINELLKLKEPK